MSSDVAGVKTAIQNQIAKHADTVKDVTARQTFVVGALTYGRQSLEHYRAKGERLAIRVVGLLSIADDVPHDLARDVIESIKVNGVFKARPDLKAALADRVTS